MLALLLICLLYVGLLSPVLCASYLALAKGKEVRFRWLFPPAAIVSVYTIAALLYIGAASVIAPLYSHMAYVVPSYAESGQKISFWFHILDWVVTYQALIFAILLLMMSVWISKFLWPRWLSRFTNA